MADPLSIAGTALGVISFALQVREEIVAYCRSWRGAHQEIQDIASKVEGLESPLEALRQLIQETELTDPQIANNLRENTETLREGIERVKTSIEKCRPAIVPETLSEKVRAHGKRAAYPFRKEALRGLANDLDAMQINLHTTLHVFSAQNVRLIPSLILMQAKLLREVQAMHLELQELPRKSSPPPPELLQSWCNTQRDLIPTRRSEKAAKKFTLHSRLLNLTITASFSLSRGAWGFSIAPSITLRVPISPNSPGFRSLGLYPLMAKSQPPAQFVDNTINLLKYLFVEKMVTPSDLTQEVLDTSHTLIRTGLDSFIGTANFGYEERQLLSLLIQRGGYLTISGTFYSAFSKANMCRVLDENEEAVNMPDIAKAVILESEEDLLAVGWARGIQLLLDAGSDMDRYQGSSPLKLAIRGSHHQSTKVLLQSGCKLTFDDIQESEHLSDEGKISTLLISELASRRRRLLKLAQANLSPKELLELDVEDDAIPDTTASRIHNALVARGARVDPALQIQDPSSSIYHHHWMKIATLDLFFEAGFKNVDLIDSSGRTPLMVKPQYSSMTRIPIQGDPGSFAKAQILARSSYPEHTPQPFTF
ncbi:hypothetical protein N7462_009379 [Penicillium macrosclerotiorum]|uniref:uncharacterized protein n=1 Tax=Penicillium macrosclerotiorum TaxID=303699 RepID=UPI0025467BF3|nr:uncharacterized protein N7462_009379 [Penicillium macrosclerotiorum]KAJ5673940.1 hypothetical protein N7462_009379 [Penicillium macrosclerotiorum]